jgi:hypothetical protein
MCPLAPSIGIWALGPIYTPTGTKGSGTEPELRLLRHFLQLFRHHICLARGRIFFPIANGGSMRIQILALTTLICALPLGAQGRGRNIDGVPPGHRPPAGLCRVWINGVPPGQQPAVTDCASAILSVPRNGRVLYGSGTTKYRNRSNDRSWLERMRDAAARERLRNEDDRRDEKKGKHAGKEGRGNGKK